MENCGKRPSKSKQRFLRRRNRKSICLEFFLRSFPPLADSQKPIRRGRMRKWRQETVLRSFKPQPSRQALTESSIDGWKLKALLARRRKERLTNTCETKADKKKLLSVVVRLSFLLLLASFFSRGERKILLLISFHNFLRFFPFSILVQLLSLIEAKKMRSYRWAMNRRNGKYCRRAFSVCTLLIRFRLVNDGE